MGRPYSATRSSIAVAKKNNSCVILDILNKDDDVPLHIKPRILELSIRKSQIKQVRIFSIFC